VVVSEGREFLAGEEMANILVIKKIKRMKNSNNGFFSSLNNPSSIFCTIKVRLRIFSLLTHESVAVILLDFFVQKA
jgi:hypothetical protein